MRERRFLIPAKIGSNPTSGAAGDGRPEASETVIIRLPQSLVTTIRQDLRRAHPSAAERGGFLFARGGTGPAGVHFLFPTAYQVVADEHYVAPTDQWAAAAIGGAAIRSAMQEVMRSGLSGLHVHLHDHMGRPRFSRTDERDAPRLAQSLANASPSRIHGVLLLSADSATGQVWVPTATGVVRTSPSVSLVGYPLRLMSGAPDAAWTQGHKASFEW